MPETPRRSYGDILGRPADDPHRDEIRADADWTPIALPGRPGWWRHWINGQQVDLNTDQPPAN